MIRREVFVLSLLLMPALALRAQALADAFKSPADRAPNALSASLGLSANPYFMNNQFGFCPALGYQRMFGTFGLDVSLQESMHELDDDPYSADLYPASWDEGDGYVNLVGYFLRLKPILSLSRRGYTNKTGSMFYGFGELGFFAQTHTEDEGDGHHGSEFPFLGFRPFDIGLGLGGEFTFLYLMTPFIEASMHVAFPYEGNMGSRSRHWGDPLEAWWELEAGIRLRFGRDMLHGASDRGAASRSPVRERPASSRADDLEPIHPWAVGVTYDSNSYVGFSAQRWFGDFGLELFAITWLFNDSPLAFSEDSLYLFFLAPQFTLTRDRLTPQLYQRVYVALPIGASRDPWDEWHTWFSSTRHTPWAFAARLGLGLEWTSRERWSTSLEVGVQHHDLFDPYYWKGNLWPNAILSLRARF
jgi:hypothetical protein